MSRCVGVSPVVARRLCASCGGGGGGGGGGGRAWGLEGGPLAAGARPPSLPALPPPLGGPARMLCPYAGFLKRARAAAGSAACTPSDPACDVRAGALARECAGEERKAPPSAAWSPPPPAADAAPSMLLLLRSEEGADDRRAAVFPAAGDTRSAERNPSLARSRWLDAPPDAADGTVTALVPPDVVLTGDSEYVRDAALPAVASPQPRALGAPSLARAVPTGAGR